MQELYVAYARAIGCVAWDEVYAGKIGESSIFTGKEIERDESISGEGPATITGLSLNIASELRPL